MAAYWLDVAGEALQWLACLFVVALYLDYRRLRARIEKLEGRQ